jgi:hypothetical protein
LDRQADSISGDENYNPGDDDVVEDGPLAALRDEFADVDKAILEMRDDARRAALERAGK